MRRFLSSLAILIALCSGAGFGQERTETPDKPHAMLGGPIEEAPAAHLPANVLSLADLEALALRNNPSLARSASLIDAAKGKRLQAGLYPNPKIGYHATEIGVRGTAGQQGGIASQRIVTAGKLKLNRNAAEQEVQWAVHQFEAQKQRVLSDVRIQFYDVLVAQRRLFLTEKLVKVGAEGAKAADKLHKAEQVGLNDVLQARIEADGAKILFGKAQNSHREAWQRLAAVAGQPHLSPMPLAGSLDHDLPTHNWQNLLPQILANSPEMAASRAKVEQAHWKLKRESVEPIPDVEVILSVRHHNFTRDDVANVQVMVPIPIFDRNQGNILQARAELAAAFSDLRRVELNLQDRLAMAFRRYADAVVQVNAYRGRIIPNAAKSLRLVQKGYQNRQIDYLNFLVSQRTYFQVNLAYLDALRELRASAAVIEGQLLQGSLQP